MHWLLNRQQHRLAYFLAQSLHKYKNPSEQHAFSRIIRRLAIANVVFGFLGVLMSMTIFEGFEQDISSRLHRFLGHVHIEPFKLSEEDNRYFSLPEDITHPSSLVHAEGVAYAPALMKKGDHSHAFLSKGVQHPHRLSQHLVLGRTPAPNSYECLMGQEAARNAAVKIGDTLLLHFLQNPPRYRKLTLVGLYETGLFEDIDKVILPMPISVLHRLHNKSEREFMGIDLFLNTENHAESLASQLSYDLPEGLHAITTQEKYPHLFDWLKLIKRNAHLFVTLTLFVAAFNMLSILLILTMERTYMVGLLQALGASRSLMASFFSYYALLLVAKGMFWGNLLTLSLTWLQARFHLWTLDPETYLLPHVPVSWNIKTWLTMNACLFLTLCLPVVVPVLRMLKHRPAQLLTFR